MDQENKTLDKNLLMNLKPQTVYIPITFDESFNGGRVVVATHEVSPHECMSLKGGDMYLKQKENQICLSKQELMQVLIDYTDQVIGLPGHIKSLSYDEIEQFINNLFNK